MRTDSDLTVPDRTHIMPMGFEEDRIIKPTRKFKADKLVIIRHENDDTTDDSKERFEEHLENVKKDLSTIGVTPEMKKCDIFDVYDSLRAISESINEHKNDHVYVNLSAGSKITAIAGMIACMCSDTEPYYARATDYTGKSPSKISEINALPKYKIDPPTSDQIEILDHLDKTGPLTKKDLIKFGEASDLDFLSDFNGKEKGKYRRLQSRIIAPLGESEYITVQRSGRERIVKMTRAGNNARKAFQHLAAIEPEPEGHGQESIQATLK